MDCHLCGSSKMGMIPDLPDSTAEGQSYRAAASGAYTQHSVVYRDAIIGSDNWEVTNTNKLHDAVKRRPRSALGKLLSLLFSHKQVRAHHGTTKMGAIESLVCCDCGALQWMLQDPQWFDWSDAKAALSKEKPMQNITRCRRCNATELGLLAALPDTVGSESDVVPQVVGVTKEGERIGQLQAIVCTQCGLLEPFVKSAREVPFDSIEGFSPLKEGSTYR